MQKAIYQLAVGQGVNLNLIAEQWDNLLRLAGSLKLGVAQASGLMRMLQTNNSPTKLARALADLGRIIKTMHLLNCGELRQRYRQGQEDQLGALGLIVNAVVLWNTIYIDAALKQLRKEGLAVRDEDVARLSPLGHEHINMLGRYTFTLPDVVARGKLRPLRNPALVPEDA
jgi:TnpA family transposase